MRQQMGREAAYVAMYASYERQRVLKSFLLLGEYSVWEETKRAEKLH